ncbi:rNA methyltransferase TrmH family [Prevotella sp. CAG:1124]|nr:rNA methyltransferase TrmH family [Prevotella sp. CAG:1124]
MSYPKHTNILTTLSVNAIDFNYFNYINYFNYNKIMRKLKVTEMNRLTVDEFRTSDKMPLTVVLDDVRSLYNVGSVLRSCDAFRVEKVVLCGITAAPPHPEIHKTALGAEDSVSWRHADSALEAVRELRRQGVTVMAVEQCEGSTMLNTFVPETGRRYAVVLGNEVKGVRQDVVDECDGCLEIPQFGTKHSLNVSVTAGIVVWHFCQASMNNS